MNKSMQTGIFGVGTFFKSTFGPPFQRKAPMLPFYINLIT